MNNKDHDLAEQIAEMQAEGKKVVLVVGESQQIQRLVERLGKDAEIVTPLELADKVFEIKPLLTQPDIEPLPPKDKQYWKPQYRRTFKK